jgi:DNA-binding transcriptional regulator YiaG
MAVIEELLSEARTRQALPPPAVCRALRVRVGLTQQELASLLEVHKTTITRWESGARIPRRKACTEFALLLERLAKEVSAN